ncbi:MAG: hypothetical protein ACJ76H_09505 [Bacteriovoracaceae bacterium]
MKFILFAIAFSFINSAFADESKIIAKCGDYALSQGVQTTYFAGIKHTQNIYSLLDETGAEEPMEITVNSEGAVLKSMDLSLGYKINAMWNTFELSINDQKIKCEKLN